jgi:NAD(P)-dependent dehydrogenase (short-subunit alcohol dehydrogenase family)
MKQIDLDVYGPWALITGASSGIGREFARQAAASGINVVMLARGEERLKEVAASLATRYHVHTRTVALDLGHDGILGPISEATDDLDIGLDVSAVDLPVEMISAEEAVDEALSALAENKATTINRAELAQGYEGLKSAVIPAIKARLAASRPAH